MESEIEIGQGMAMKTDKVWEKDGYRIRLAQPSDAEAYYAQNYNPLDKEAARLTGCKENFTKEEVISFFRNSIDDSDRYFFLILAPNGQIIGESVLNEIDWRVRRANFRIGIYQEAERGKGIGTWAIEVTRDFAFEDLKLHRLELDVFSFNPRAERAYKKAGFCREGVLRDAVMDGENYADDILMAILEHEWRQMKKSKPAREDKMYYSYVMGIGSEIEELKNKGFTIERFGENYGVSFSKDKADEWEHFIGQHLELGYWNEYLTECGVVFLFHLDSGIRRYYVENYFNDEVLTLCEKLCECKFTSIKDMLKENHFYRDKII